VLLSRLYKKYRTQKWPVASSPFGWLIYLWTSMFIYSLWFIHLLFLLTHSSLYIHCRLNSSFTHFFIRLNFMSLRLPHPSHLCLSLIHPLTLFTDLLFLLILLNHLMYLLLSLSNYSPYSNKSPLTYSISLHYSLLSLHSYIMLTHRPPITPLAESLHSLITHPLLIFYFPSLTQFSHFSHFTPITCLLCCPRLLTHLPQSLISLNRCTHLLLTPS